MLGAADVRVIFLDAERRRAHADDVPTLRPRRAASSTSRPAERPSSIRTIATTTARATAVATVPAGSGQALVLAQPLDVPGPHAAQARHRHARLRRSRRARRRAGRLGGRHQRPAARTSPDRCPSSRTPSPRTCARCRSRATTRSPDWPPPSTRCSAPSRPRATGSAGWSPTPVTSCAPRSPPCGPTSTCSPRPTTLAACREDARRELLDDVRGQIEELTTLVGDLVDARPRRTARGRRLHPATWPRWPIAR